MGSFSQDHLALALELPEPRARQIRSHMKQPIFQVQALQWRAADLEQGLILLGTRVQVPILR